MGFVNVPKAYREQRDRGCAFWVGVGLEGGHGLQTLVQIEGQFSGCPEDWRAFSE